MGYGLIGNNIASAEEVISKGVATNGNNNSGLNNHPSQNQESPSEDVIPTSLKMKIKKKLMELGYSEIDAQREVSKLKNNNDVRKLLENLKNNKSSENTNSGQNKTNKKTSKDNESDSKKTKLTGSLGKIVLTIKRELEKMKVDNAAEIVSSIDHIEKAKEVIEEYELPFEL